MSLDAFHYPEVDASTTKDSQYAPKMERCRVFEDNEVALCKGFSRFLRRVGAWEPEANEVELLGLYRGDLPSSNACRFIKDQKRDRIAFPETIPIVFNRF
jgi:hypothetical protein